MKKEQICKGFEINTITGGLKVTGYNGSIVYLEEYTANDDGNLEFTGESRLTLEEIAKVMKEMDGLNHKIEFVYRYEVDCTDPDTGATSPVDIITLGHELIHDWEKEDIAESYKEYNGDITFVEVDN